jgi:hypothetical protein
VGSPEPDGRATPDATDPPGMPTETFTGNGVSFRYPEEWREFSVTDTSASAGDELWNETVGLDDVNFVSVAGYEINVEITHDTIEGQAGPIGDQIGALFAQAGGELLSGPDTTTLAGLPALRSTGTAINPSGAEVTSTLVLAFDGTTEYFVNCQYDEDGRSDILAGCDVILATFDVAG